MAIKIRKITLDNKSRKGLYWYITNTDTKKSNYYKGTIPQDVIEVWINNPQKGSTPQQQRKNFNTFIRGIQVPKEPLQTRVKPKPIVTLKKRDTTKPIRLLKGDHTVTSTKEEFLAKPITKQQELLVKTGVKYTSKKKIDKRLKQLQPFTEHEIEIFGINERTNSQEKIASFFVHNKTLQTLKDEIALRLYSLTQDSTNKYIKDALLPFEPFINSKQIFVPRGVINDYTIKSTIKGR